MGSSVAARQRKGFEYALRYLQSSQQQRQRPGDRKSICPVEGVRRYKGLGSLSRVCRQKSGSTSDRDGFQALFQDASQRKIDVVLFWSLDRFSREGVVETLEHLGHLSGYGLAYRSLTEQYLGSTGIWKDAIIGILATIAKQERIRLSERVKAGLRRARRAGKTLGGSQSIIDVGKIRALRAAGKSWDAIGAQTGTSARTCKRRFAG